jgi:hypothetical protein
MEMRMTMRKTLKITFLVLLAGLSLAMPVAGARADLMIMPVRVVFQGHDRTSNVTLVNVADHTETYRLSWMYQLQKEDGSYTQLPGPIDAAHDPAKMVVFSPRQVTLEAGEQQNIRLSLRRPPDLPDGEYHAHLRFQATGADATSTSALTKKGVSTELLIHVGFAIPVMIRQGHYDATATISDPHFIPATAQSGAELQVTLNRGGHYGTTGVLKAFWTPHGGNEKQIGLLNNTNTFTEVTHRTARIRLTESRIVGETVRVVYEGDGPDKGISYDEKTFPVGG